MPELRSHRESSTLPADRIPIEGDHLFQAIPTTHSDEPEKVAAFSPEWLVAFRRNQWSPSRRNRWPPSPGKRNLSTGQPLGYEVLSRGAAPFGSPEVMLDIASAAPPRGRPVPSRVDRLDSTNESWRVFLAPFNVSTRSGEHLEANWAPEFERLDEPFEIARGVVIPPGRYRFDCFRVESQSSSFRPWRVGSTVWLGTFFGGHLTQWQSFLYWTVGPGRLRFELDAENDFGYLPQGDFIQRLLQLKTVYAFSPDIVLSVFTQYDSESRDLGFNSRLRWTIRPGRDLFLVWNQNWKRVPKPGYRLESDSDQVVLKLRWTFLW